ncbi:hypothetical protein [Dongia sedimenti]|uniref:PEP-CTERM sorting domain-containing protein n=1 Tax=Dongia sedimenti TaxID=3064282 RepID=A0ABU0YSP0_9PROT|nr:hypothetical protein [Rhodospirillaceae bacterium R-7]
MNRLLMSMLALVAVALAALPAKAVTITYSTSGSNAQVFLTPTSSGDIGYPPNSTFSLTEQLTFGNTSGGSYGQAFTYIPFTVATAGFLSATVTDLSMSNPSAKPLEWLSLALYEYTGSGMSYLTCGSGGGLCTLEAYDADPPVASIAAALAAGTQYLLRVGFGLCGCSGDFGGIQLTVATTPIPPAMLLFVSALLGMGGVAWRRRRTVEAAA